jgi:hypothetical protein
MIDMNFVGMMCAASYLIGLGVGYLLRKVTEK